MTEGLELTAGDETEQDKVDPRWVSPVVAWLASTRSKDVTGRVIQASGRYWAIAQGWHRGPEGVPTEDPNEAEVVLRPLLDAALGERRAGRRVSADPQASSEEQPWVKPGSSTASGRRAAGGRRTGRCTTSIPKSSSPRS